MRATVCAEWGAPENLRVEERPDLVPGPGQVVVDVRACGINFVDTLLIQGTYQVKVPTPFVPGGEIAGVVSAVGEGVEGVSLGDSVMAMTMVNGMAEQALVYAGSILPLPPRLGFERGACFFQAYNTALFALKIRAGLKAGETVLVLGAAGGVGLAAIDVARALGARVIAAASSPEKLAACRRQGADEGIDYAKEDLKARAKELSGGGVDVVYDPVGGDFADPALRALAPNGRYLVVGFASGTIPRVPFNLMLLKQCQVVGVDWGGWSGKHPEENAALCREAHDLVEAGRLDPNPPRAFAFDEAPLALRALMDREIIGKAVVVSD